MAGVVDEVLHLLPVPDGDEAGPHGDAVVLRVHPGRVHPAELVA